MAQPPDLRVRNEERSIALHRAVADRLREDPTLIERARERVDAWLAEGLIHPVHGETWRRLLTGPLDRLLALLTRDDDDEIVVIGSQAVLGQFPDAPPEMLVSMEADVFPRHRPERASLIEGSIGELSPFHESFGYYAEGVAPHTAKLPTGWEQRLVPVPVGDACAGQSRRPPGPSTAVRRPPAPISPHPPGIPRKGVIWITGGVPRVA